MSEVNELMTARVIENTLCCYEGHVKIVQLSKDKSISVVNTGTDRLYVFERDIRVGILELPGVLICWDVVCMHRVWFLLCGLQDGRIISCNLQPWCHQAKKKKSKSKFSKSEGSNDACLGNRGNADGRCNGEEDIFKDLLGDGDEKTDDEEGEFLKTQMDDFYEVLGNVTKVSDDGLLLEVRGRLEDFLLVNGCIVTCCRVEMGWKISAYKCDVDDSKSLPLRCGSVPVYDTLVFSADSSLHDTWDINTIGVLPSSPSSSSPSWDYHYINRGRHCQDKDRSTPQRASLQGIISSSSHGNQMMLQSSNMLRISDNLFEVLWGSEPNLIDSPVILITLPDGCVYSLLLKQPHPGLNPSSKTLSLFYQLVQPVIGAWTIKLAKDDSDHFADCLTLVGRHGQIVALYLDPTDSTKFTQSVHYIKGPLSACAAAYKGLVCASNLDLTSVTLQMSNDADSLLKLTVQSHGIPGLLALVQMGGKGSNGKLLALKKNGTVLHISLPSPGHVTEADQSAISATAAGQRIKELLHAISEISSKMATVTATSDRQNRILEELSQAHHVVGQVYDEKESAFQLDVKVEYLQESGQNRFKVVCNVTNNTQWTLSQGWVLLISLSGCLDWCDGDNCNKYHCTKSIPLVDFAPRTSVSLSYELDATKVMLKLPLTVHCSLYFDLEMCSHQSTSLAMSLSHGVNSSVVLESTKQGAIFSIASAIVDILDVLQPVRASSSDKDTTVPLNRQRHRTNEVTSCNCQQGSNWLKSALQKSSGVSPTDQNQICSAAENRLPSLTIHVDKLLLSALCGDTDVDLPCTLLKLLVSSNPSLQATGTCIEVTTPEGQLVSLQAVESIESGIIGIRLVAPDDVVITRLAEAVHRRLKTSRLVSASSSVDTHKLNKEKNIAKCHHASLQSIQDQLSGTNAAGLQDVGRQVTEIYKHMRDQLILH